jgi:hypothetical protein
VQRGKLQEAARMIAFSLLTGFFPTYGPSFIHFYGSDSVEKNGCASKCLTPMPLYRGRVLLSLETEMDDPEASPGIGVETASAFSISIEVIRFATDASLPQLLFSSRLKLTFVREKPLCHFSIYGVSNVSINFNNCIKSNWIIIYFITLAIQASFIILMKHSTVSKLIE